MNQNFLTVIRVRLERGEGSSNKDANMNAIRNVKWDLKGTCHNKYPIHMLHTRYSSVCILNSIWLNVFSNVTVQFLHLPKAMLRFYKKNPIKHCSLNFKLHLMPDNSLHARSSNKKL
ncbi:hypothetical protein ACKWTF_008850 [Chironomus riparius]